MPKQDPAPSDEPTLRGPFEPLAWRGPFSLFWHILKVTPQATLCSVPVSTLSRSRTKPLSEVDPRILCTQCQQKSRG